MVNENTEVRSDRKKVFTTMRHIATETIKSSIGVIIVWKAILVYQ